MKIKNLLIFNCICFLLLTASATAQDLDVFATGFSSPVDIQNAGDGRLFIVERSGTIDIIEGDGTVLPTPFLNITSQVSSGGERGLLGIAFHPDYQNNGYFYVNYTNSSGGLATRISRFTVSAANPNVADPNSELVLLTIPQPFNNHNAGCLRFGPDGFLYIGMGDGGSGGDPLDLSQNINELLGKMLRIDVNNPGLGLNYGIPSNNMFVGTAGRDEIYSVGLRNPWRFSFDSANGDLWIADVGQNAWEEVNYAPAGTGLGQNYGWRCYEGNAAFNTSGCLPASAYDFPLFVYNHSFASGGFSITGGYVYRGNRYPEFQGKYFAADFVTGNWWLIESNGVTQFLPSFQEDISAFGEDIYGELYAADLSSGIIYNISSTQPITTCTAAPVLNCGQGLSGNSAGPTTSISNCATGATQTARGSWFQHTAQSNTVTLDMCNVNYDSQVLVYEGSCATPICVAGNNNAATGVCGSALASSLTFSAIPGTTYFIYASGATSADTGDFYIELSCDNSATVVIDADVMLGGSFESATGLMRDDLRSLGLIPTTEPYTALGYNHVIGGGETIAPIALANLGSNSIVDWLVLELRDQNNPALVVESRSALLKRNGDIVDTDGFSNVNFTSPAGNYYVAIQHRNHLGIMTASAISFSTTSLPVLSFSTSTPTFGTNAQTSASPFLMWPGDGNMDGAVIYQGSSSDILPITTAVFTNPVNTAFQVTLPFAGYDVGDYDMDGEVIYQGSGSDILGITQTVFTHPSNSSFQLTFPILEQVP